MLRLGLVIWSKVPPVERTTNPNTAALIGLAFGGIGLGIYFRNVLDSLVPIAIAIVLAVKIGDLGFWGGVIPAGIYGYMRSLESNARRNASTTSTVQEP